MDTGAETRKWIIKSFDHTCTDFPFTEALLGFTGARKTGSIPDCSTHCKSSNMASAEWWWHRPDDGYYSGWNNGASKQIFRGQQSPIESVRNDNKIGARGAK